MMQDQELTQFEELSGRIAAQNILLRTLYAKEAMEEARPREFMRMHLNALIDSIYGSVRKPEDPSDARIWLVIEDYLRAFQEQVDLRISTKSDI